MLQPNKGHGRFRALWLATGISSVGDGMVVVAFPLLALRLTRNPVSIAGVVVAARLAALVVALPVGAVVDRVDRRRLVLSVEMSRAATMAGFGISVVAGYRSLLVIYLAAFLLGGLTVALDVISAACLPSMVDGRDLAGANARLLTAELMGEELVGQAAGGVAFAAAAALPFVADAASFALSAGLLTYAVPGGDRRRPSRSLVRDVALGLRWLLSDPLLRTLAAVVACLAGCQAMVYGVLALYATGLLHLGTAGYGLFLAVAGSGNVVGAVSAGRLHQRFGGAWCILGAAAVAIAGYLAMAATSSVPLAAGALAAETGAVIVGNVSVRTLRQSAAGEDMQGRAASAFQVLILGALPLGGLAGGLLAPAVGIRGVLVVAAALQAVVLSAMGTRLVIRVRFAGRAGPVVEAGAGTPSAL